MTLKLSLYSRYKDLVDPSGFQRPCHYLTHYSNAAIVLHYLLRVEPFTSLHIKLQGGKFDCSDRQFYSLAKSWYGLVNSTGDVRELIPEFFCFPDFLSNINKLDLGCLQVGLFTIRFLSSKLDQEEFQNNHQHHHIIFLHKNPISKLR